MFKKIYYLDIRIRFYCFILRCELEIICSRNDHKDLWDKVFRIISDKEHPVRLNLQRLYNSTNRKFIFRTIEWVDYFVKCYEQRYLGIDWKI